MTDATPSGAQYEIVHGDQRATVVEVGGGLREYTVAGVDVLQPYAPDAMCDGAHGAVLVPWPNRIGDGRYEFDGVEHQLALTEPSKHNAIHGLLRWVPWRAATREQSSVVMAAQLFPSPGYPYALDAQVRYALGPDGLQVTASVTNSGSAPCPYGIGHHPYLSPGDGLIDECHLQFSATTRIVTDPQRQLPTGTAAVAGSAYDFRRSRRIGDVAFDFAFTGLGRDDDGCSRVRLERADGSTVELWLGAAYPYLELYTADTLAADRRRRGIAVEPMTCPPDAFRSGEGVIRLSPGTAHETTWGVRLQ